MRRLAVAPLLLGAVVLASAVVAAFLERPVWAAVAGSGLVLVYWALETLAWRRSMTGSFNHAVVAAVGGAAARIAVVLVSLVLIGVFARQAFAVAALSFLAGFTVYLGVRLYAFSGPASIHGAASR